MIRIVLAILLAALTACSSAGSLKSLETPTTSPSVGQTAGSPSEAAAALLEFKSHLEAGADRPFVDAINSASDPYVLGAAYAAYDKFIEEELAWFDAHLPAPCYEQLWRAARKSATGQHDLVMYAAARIQIDHPDLGTVHIVSVGEDRAFLDNLIAESKATVKSAVQEQGRLWDSSVCP